MVTLKTKISKWLDGKSFENSKSALWDFEKQTGEKCSIIYFSRVFAQKKADVKKTKKEKVADFIRRGKFKTCEEAHNAYCAGGEDVSLIYFSRVYTAVRKEKGISTGRTTLVSITGLTAKQIILVVKDKVGKDIKVDTKNKALVTKKAMKLLTDNGYKVK